MSMDFTKSITFSKERNISLYSDYELGFTYEELVNKYSICKSRVQEIIRLFKRRDLTLKRRELRKELQ